MRARLYTLTISHFCERARWALDVSRFPYDEVRWAPGSHAVAARKLGAASGATPILLVDGDLIQGSGRILDRLSLPGADPAVEERLVDQTAPLIRRCLYAGLLPFRGSGVRAALLRGVRGRQALVGRALWPVLRPKMIQLMGTQPELMPELIERLEGELDWFDGILAERGDRLAGALFGRADLTAASLLAPLARPDTPPMNRIYAGLRFAPPVADALERWSSRPTIGWVRRTYAEHRSPS